MEDYKIAIRSYLSQKEVDINVIAHEAAHVTFMMMDNKGLPNTEDNEEVFCYLIRYIVEKVLKYVKI